MLPSAQQKILPIEEGGMSDAGHTWHVWINRRQQELGGAPWEHSLYEFKNMLEFLSYGAGQIESAFEGKLPQTHQQCSHQPVEQLPVLNTLKCSREGVDVTKCPILQSLAEAFREETTRERFPKDHPKSVLYDLMAKTCAWHIYTGAINAPEGHQFRFDTSMGYLLDETDRVFWDRVHSSMSLSTEELTADGNWCPDCGEPKEACKCAHAPLNH